jgi:hypothetical protein
VPSPPPCNRQAVAHRYQPGSAARGVTRPRSCRHAQCAFCRSSVWVLRGSSPTAYLTAWTHIATLWSRYSTCQGRRRACHVRPSLSSDDMPCLSDRSLFVSGVQPKLRSRTRRIASGPAESLQDPQNRSRTRSTLHLGLGIKTEGSAVVPHRQLSGCWQFWALLMDRKVIVRLADETANTIDQPAQL